MMLIKRISFQFKCRDDYGISITIVTMVDYMLSGIFRKLHTKRATGNKYLLTFRGVAKARLVALPHTPAKQDCKPLATGSRPPGRCRSHRHPGLTGLPQHHCGDDVRARLP
jgi:hypothetical protein